MMPHIYSNSNSILVYTLITVVTLYNNNQFSEFVQSPLFDDKITYQSCYRCSIVLQNRIMERADKMESGSSQKNHAIKRWVIVLTLVLSLVSVKGLSLSMPTGSRPSFQRVLPQSFIWVVLFFSLWIGLSFLSTVSDAGTVRNAVKLTCFYSVCHILGWFFQTRGTIECFWNGVNESINFVCYAVGYASLTFCFILFIFYVLQRISPSPKVKSFKSRKVIYPVVVILLLLFWLPWFLQQCPGITTPDSNNQIRQAMGGIPISDNHPVFHTLWIKLLFIVGGSAQKGVMLYSVAQLLISALVFAACICFIDSVAGRNIVTIAVFLWFALYPVYPIYAITIWKDVPFALCLLLVVINICKIIRSDDEERKHLLVWNTLLFLILCFLRHNGILIFIPSAVIILVNQKKYRKMYLSACLIVITVYLLFQYIGIPLLNIRAGRSSEGFSIPLQQIARVASKYPDKLTSRQNEVISRYFSADLTKIYRPTLSDKVKKSFNEEMFAHEPLPMLRLWRELGIRHPWDYFESILHNSFGFWYPEENHATFFFGLDVPGMYGLYQTPVIRSSLMHKAEKYLEDMRYYSVPILSFMFSPAIGAWILMFAWFYCRYCRNRFWIALVPLLSLWIQMFGSPAYCEFRYVYGLFTCLPMIICCTLFSLQECDRENTDDHLLKSSE